MVWRKIVKSINHHPLQQQCYHKMIKETLVALDCLWMVGIHVDGNELCLFHARATIMDNIHENNELLII